MLTTRNDFQLPRSAIEGGASAPRAGRSGWSRLRRTLVRAAGGTVALIALAAAAGASYEAIAGLGDASAYAPAGRLVDVGDHRLHISCMGQGSPTVVLDAGLGRSSLDWILVQPELATTTRVCVYDRAGMGWSDAGPSPRSPSRIAEELHLLLANAGIHGPYVLVAHSLAGKNARMFAATHPEDVAGMVLVDARSERMDATASLDEVEAFYAALRGQGAVYSLARRLGVVRILGASLWGLPLVPPAVASEMAILQTQPAAIDATTREGLARAADDAALAGSTLGSLPLVVIAAGSNMEATPGWADAQQHLAALSSRGRLVVAESSGHDVHLLAPDLVINGVRDVLAEARAQP